MEETITTFRTPAFLAASMRRHVPTLSTACAAAFILRGLPGTNPRATTRESAPARAASMSASESETTSRRRRATDAAASTEPTFWTMAPRTTVLSSDRALVAFSTLRTPPTTERPGVEARRSRTRRPVWPVAPATTTTADPLVATSSPSARAAVGKTDDAAATAAAEETRAETAERRSSSGAEEDAESAVGGRKARRPEVDDDDDNAVRGTGPKKAEAGREERRRGRRRTEGTIIVGVCSYVGGATTMAGRFCFELAG
mmetsp:Transcript_22599/g.45769  ORF Transcript_22599/g.45769 Transcript_22599/m.45769 type:complete len:258 (+) Transcript_22599:351-1124(+)